MFQLWWPLGLSGPLRLPAHSQVPIDFFRWLRLTTTSVSQLVPRKNCDFEPWVRGPPYPVFCEKRTDIVDGQYITTRGCSQETWEDIKGYQSVRDGHIPCIRRGRKETCLCSEDSCNSAPSLSLALSITLPLLTSFLLFCWGQFIWCNIEKSSFWANA